jgi:hypothetical protein
MEEKAAFLKSCQAMLDAVVVTPKNEAEHAAAVVHLREQEFALAKEQWESIPEAEKGAAAMRDLATATAQMGAKLKCIATLAKAGDKRGKADVHDFDDLDRQRLRRPKDGEGVSADKDPEWEKISETIPRRHWPVAKLARAVMKFHLPRAHKEVHHLFLRPDGSIPHLHHTHHKDEDPNTVALVGADLAQVPGLGEFSQGVEGKPHVDGWSLIFGQEHKVPPPRGEKGYRLYVWGLSGQDWLPILPTEAGPNGVFATLEDAQRCISTKAYCGEDTSIYCPVCIGDPLPPPR